MSRIKVEESTRVNIFIGRTLFNKSSVIAEELGLPYPEYIRHLLTLEVKKRENPPEIPLAEGNIMVNNNPVHLGTKKREKLIKIMHEIRRMV